MVQQQVAVITLPVEDLAKSRQFYESGFGWKPVFESEEILFFEMNGFVLGLWNRESFRRDTMLDHLPPPGAQALAHNVQSEDAVGPLMNKLIEAGGKLLRPDDAPPHGGRRGYVADPDGHIWEIAWNPDWPIDASGHVRFVGPD